MRKGRITMRKLATLLLAAGLVFCSVTGASAIDFKAKGQWIMSFDYGHGGEGYTDRRGHGNTVTGSGFSSDSFNAVQRVRLQLEAVASESLSGTVYFEIGNSTWGKDSGRLGADVVAVEVKHAYLDWVVPSTDVKVRMGIQGLSLPSYAGGSQVFVQDVAGIVLSNKFNDTVALTAFWARPYNDNFDNKNGDTAFTAKIADANYLDNVDAFGLVLPLTFDGFTLVPWATYTMVGQNAYRDPDLGIQSTLDGLLPLYGLKPATLQTLDRDDLYSYGSVWHFGLTGEVTLTDPLRIAWDLNYGSADFGHVNNAGALVVDKANDIYAIDDLELQRSGYFASLLVEYKMDFGTPGLYAWYSSGDDDNPLNGSERMPVINNGNGDSQYSNFALNGNPYLANEAVLGTNLIGTWGLGIRLKDFSFMEDLKQTLRFNYFNGTNHTEMARFYTNHGLGGGLNPDTEFNYGNGMYLTTDDYAFEIGLTSDYKIYDNLKLYVDAAYLILDMSGDEDEVWGDRYTGTDAFNINASFVYSF